MGGKGADVKDVLTVLAVVLIIGIGPSVAEVEGIGRSGNTLLVDDNVAGGLAGEGTSRVAGSSVGESRAALARLGGS